MRHIQHFDEKWNTKELDHLRTCDSCVEALADYVEAHELISAPRRLKKSVMDRCQKPDALLTYTAGQMSKKLIFLLYSIKIGTAMTAAIAFITLFPLRPMELYEQAHEYTRQLSDFTIFEFRR